MTINNHDKNREFLSAVFENTATAEKLLETDPKYLHYRSIAGETPFHYLVVENMLEQASKLLEWGSDINTQDEFGDTPLMHATKLGNYGAVQWLVARGAKLEYKNCNDETVISYSTTNYQREIFEFLIQHPRQFPIDYYFDDLTAQAVYENEDLEMRDCLIKLGLTVRFPLDQ